MIKNNKGFMLAEVVITSTVVLTSLVILYSSFTKIYTQYKVRDTYFDVDGMYAIRAMVNHLTSNGGLNKILSAVPDSADDDGEICDDDSGGHFKQGLACNNYLYLIEKGNCDSIFEDETFCVNLVSTYGIENMIIAERTDEILDKNKNDSLTNSSSGLNLTFIDYLNDFVKNRYDFSDKNESFNYFVIVEYDEDNDKKFNYSSLILR